MFAITALVVALAAPVPKAKASELYFPTVEGTKRVMQREVGNKIATTTETVSKVEEKDGKHTVTVSREVGGKAVEFHYEVSEKGVFTLSNPNGKLDEPEPLLKLPAKEGDTWTRERPDKSTVTLTVGKEEEVEVPAGKFKAVPVVTTIARKGRVDKGTTWYAPGVGVVKQSVEIGDIEQIQELKEFTPGKAK